MKHAPVRHRLEIVLFEAVLRLLKLLPHPASRRIGRSLGGAGWSAIGRRRRVALENLALAFPDLPAAERETIGREAFRHFAGMAFDGISSFRFDRSALLERIEIQGWEHYEQAEARERGLLMMSGHLGTWEIAAQVPALLGRPLHIIGRPLNNPYLNRRLMELRTRFGNDSILKRGAARGSMRVLRERGHIGILIDQRVQPQHGILVPFFGQPAFTAPLLAKLVLRTGVPVVPTYGHLEPGGRYRVVFHPALDLAVGGDDETAVREITRRALANVEERIREAPGTWMWGHRRWRQTA
jgi:KDO2-lipid IV(A) lauroyltransferase